MRKLIVILIFCTISLSSFAIDIEEISKLAFGSEKVMDEYLKKNGDINVCDDRGINLLMLASINGDIYRVKYLLKNGININHKSKERQNAFHSAIMSFMNNIEIMKYLIENGINIYTTFNYKDSNNWNAFLLSVECGNIDVLDFLFTLKYDIEHSNSKKETSLHIASRGENHEKILLYLLKRNVNINARDIEGDTPLINSAFRGRIKNMEILLKYNANVNIQNNEGNTALHYCILENRYECAKLLVKYNAKSDIKNNLKKSAHDIARELKDDKFKKLF